MKQEEHCYLLLAYCQKKIHLYHDNMCSPGIWLVQCYAQSFLGIPVDISTMCGSEVPCQERFQSLQDVDWLKMHFAA